MDDTEISLADELRSRFAVPVRGPSYRASARWMIVSTLISLTAYGAHVLGSSGDVAWPILGLMAAAGVVVLVSGWYIVTGKTTVDARGVRQEWMFEKDYPWSQVLHARHLRLPFTSRLLLRAGFGPFKAIHGGCSELDTAFADVAAIYARRTRR
jgi:hypothetical protein